MSYNKEYYYDSGNSIILNQKTKKFLQKELDFALCENCGSKLGIYISCDSSCIVCLKNIYHKTGLKLHLDFPNYEDKPKIIKDEDCG